MTQAVVQTIEAKDGTGTLLDTFTVTISPTAGNLIHLTDFVMGAAHAAAQDTIRRYDGMVLSDPRDREAFVTAMLTPRAPNAKLRAAAARYLRATRDHR